MTKIDHDAIAARVRQDRRAGTLLTGPVYIKLADMADAYLDLYDDRARIAAEWAEASQRNYQRAKSAEAERERLLYVLDGVAGAIDTGRNEPLQVWRDQINIARQAMKGDSDE